MEYLGINELGTNYASDVFNLEDLHAEDYYDKLLAAARKETERKEKERQQKQQVDFRSAGVQNVAGGIGALPGGLSGAPTVAGLQATQASAALIGAQQAAAAGAERIAGKKRSKWDA